MPKVTKYTMPVSCLGDEKLTRSELNEMCPDKPLAVIEYEQHSRWLNTIEMEAEHIGENDPDISPARAFASRTSDILRGYNKAYNTDHLRARTMKSHLVLSEGTFRGHSRKTRCHLMSLVCVAVN